jgi:hypothetical protein
MLAYPHAKLSGRFNIILDGVMPFVKDKLIKDLKMEGGTAKCSGEGGPRVYFPTCE